MHIKPQEQSVESGLRLHLSATPQKKAIAFFEKKLDSGFWCLISSSSRRNRINQQSQLAAAHQQQCGHSAKLRAVS
jgi:hypothetical protein